MIDAEADFDSARLKGCCSMAGCGVFSSIKCSPFASTDASDGAPDTFYREGHDSCCEEKRTVSPSSGRSCTILGTPNTSVGDFL